MPLNPADEKGLRKAYMQKYTLKAHIAAYSEINHEGAFSNFAANAFECSIIMFLIYVRLQNGY